METPNTPAVEVDEFADAFAALQEPGTFVDVAAKVIPDVPAIAAPTAAVVDPVVPETPVVAAVTAPVVPETPAVAPPAVDATAARIAELEAQLAAAKTPAIAAPAPVVAAPAATEVVAPVYSTEEQATIDKYRTDWPDIQAGEALVRRAEYRELVGYVFEQVRAQLNPLMELTSKQQGRTQYSDLVSLVPDYDTVRDKTLAWVETQPAYLKKAYQEVANSGSAADVADLITRFKKETGYVAPAAAAPAAATPVVPATAAPTAKALPAAAAAAVAQLRVVKSVRSEPVQAADPNDFDSAFAEFSTASK